MGSEMSVAVAAAAVLAVVIEELAARTAPPSEGRRSPPRTLIALAWICATPASLLDYLTLRFFCLGFRPSVGRYHAARHLAGSQAPLLVCVHDLHPDCPRPRKHS